MNEVVDNVWEIFQLLKGKSIVDIEPRFDNHDEEDTPCELTFVFSDKSELWLSVREDNSDQFNMFFHPKGMYPEKEIGN